jgi:hypothetical protein
MPLKGPYDLVVRERRVGVIENEAVVAIRKCISIRRSKNRDEGLLRMGPSTAEDGTVH